MSYNRLNCSFNLKSLTLPGSYIYLVQLVDYSIRLLFPRHLIFSIRFVFASLAYKLNLILLGSKVRASYKPLSLLGSHVSQLGQTDSIAVDFHDKDLL